MVKIVRCSEAGSVESGDCFVQIEPGCEGLELNINSTLMLQFGEKIRESVLDVLLSCGVQDVKITVDDHGALDWILRARVETAIMRAREEPA